MFTLLRLNRTISFTCWYSKRKVIQFPKFAPDLQFQSCLLHSFVRENLKKLGSGMGFHVQAFRSFQLFKERLAGLKNILK